LRPGRRVVRRTVIHDEHPGKLPARRVNQSRYARVLVETGNHHRACRRFRHASSLNKISGAIEQNRIAYPLVLVLVLDKELNLEQKEFEDEDEDEDESAESAPVPGFSIAPLPHALYLPLA
jgi:hypothetical protein